MMLRQLLLGHNELVELPDGLCKLPNLRELRLEKNRIRLPRQRPTSSRGTRLACTARLRWVLLL